MQRRCERTLAMSLNTLVCAWSNRTATSSRLVSISVSSPTARVMRPARAFRRLWSMFSSHGEPGARKALYRPENGRLAIADVTMTGDETYCTRKQDSP